MATYWMTRSGRSTTMGSGQKRRVKYGIATASSEPSTTCPGCTVLLSQSQATSRSPAAAGAAASVALRSSKPPAIVRLRVLASEHCVDINGRVREVAPHRLRKRRRASAPGDQGGDAPQDRHRCGQCGQARPRRPRTLGPCQGAPEDRASGAGERDDDDERGAEQRAPDQCGGRVSARSVEDRESCRRSRTAGAGPPRSRP